MLAWRSSDRGGLADGGGGRGWPCKHTEGALAGESGSGEVDVGEDGPRSADIRGRRGFQLWLATRCSEMASSCACEADGSSGRAQDGLCEEIDELGSTPAMAAAVLGGGAGARRACAAAATRGLEMPISPSAAITSSPRPSSSKLSAASTLFPFPCCELRSAALEAGLGTLGDEASLRWRRRRRSRRSSCRGGGA